MNIDNVFEKSKKANQKINKFPLVFSGGCLLSNSR